MAVLERIFKHVNENLLKQHEKNKLTYDHGRRHLVLKKGDIVWKKTRFLSNKGKGFSSKLAPNFEKFRIAERLGDQVYKLETVDGKLLPGDYHAKDFKVPGFTGELSTDTKNLASSIFF